MTHLRAPDRKLVTLETIRDITAIADADAIESATVRGWNLVVKKGEFEAGDRCLYFEIDSALPVADPRFAFLAPRGTKTLDSGTVVHRLKTAKLRGVYSQGLALPASQFPEILVAQETGADLADLLGVTKYEPPLPAGLDIVAEFPTHLGRKTDSERVQNLLDSWDAITAAGPWVATEKIDGTSLSVFLDRDSVLHVCMRNYELGVPASYATANLYWRAVIDARLEEMLTPGTGLQAEVAGPGVQGNPLGLDRLRVVIFTYLLDGRPQPRDLWPAPVNPVATYAPIYDLQLPSSAAAAVEQVDGIKSLLSPGRLTEGVVWHQADGRSLVELDGRSTFKAISNKFLARQKD